MAFGGRSTKRDSSEKSMRTYERHASQDAMAIASILVEDERYTLAAIRKWYEKLPSQQVVEFDVRNHELIAKFIEMPESRREGFLNKVTKGATGDTTRLLFIVVAILGANRAARVIELRDRYASSLAPGGGNRVTAAGIYSFAHEVSASFVYDWPSETFHAMGEYGDMDEED